jgi:large subunit ribosomal protein L35
LKGVRYFKNRGDVMPKMKTHRGAAKRFSVTGTGKIKRSKAYARHILTPKTTKSKRKLRKSAILDPTNEKAIRKLIPYL